MLVRKLGVVRKCGSEMGVGSDMRFGNGGCVGIGVRKHTSVPVNINSSYVSYESVEQSVGLVVRSSCPAGDQGALRQGYHP
jgi:hypothetical protein